jgi:hypothetical protein
MKLLTALFFASLSLGAFAEGATCKTTAYIKTGYLSTQWTPGKKEAVIDFEECLDRAKEASVIHRTRSVSYTYVDAKFKISGKLVNKD